MFAPRLNRAMAASLALCAVAVSAAPASAPPRYIAPIDDGDVAPALARLGVPPVVPGRLTFAQAVALASARSADAQAAAATAARLSADAAVAAERPNPVFTVVPDRVVAGIIGGTSPYSLALGLALALFRPGEGAARRGVREAATEAAGYDAAAALWRAHALAAAAYRDAVLARAAARTASRLVAVAGERLASADRLSAAGYVGGTEHDIAVETAGRARAEATIRAGAVARAETALAAAIGAPGRDLSTIVLDADPGLPPPPAVTAAGDLALGNRLDLQAALARYRGALASARQAHALRAGNVAVGPAYTFDRGSHRLGFSVSGELPIFHGNRARRTAAAAALNEARATAERTQAAALAAAALARADLTARLAEVASAEAAIDGLRVQEARADRLLRDGSGDRPALLDASVRRVTAELAAADARARVNTALASLEDALQTPLWPADTAGVAR